LTRHSRIFTPTQPDYPATSMRDFPSGAYTTEYCGKTLADRDGLRRADHALKEAILLPLASVAAYAFSTPEALAT
jgi:hypothetical protein